MAKTHKTKWIATLAFVLGLCCCFGASSKIAIAQIDGELKGLFEKMIPEFKGELKQKLQHALKQGHDFIELDANQFREFRDHPANPFDGWNGIDPSKLNGVIRLQFETQPVRSRKPGHWERQSESQLAELEPVCAIVAPSTVKLIDGKKQLCYGVIVSPDGNIITKLSEIENSEKLFCRMYDGRLLEATIVNFDRSNDLALVKVQANNLKPIEWADDEPTPGTFLISPGDAGIPVAMGVYSHIPRSLAGKDQAFIGVKPQRVDNGLLVVEVSANQPAEKAGLLPGDIILTLDGELLDSVTGLVNAVRSRRPGDKVLVQYLRNGETREVTVTLDGRNLGNETADRLKMMNKFGAIPSTRNSEFPIVLQHDTPLLPEQCGGPLLDLNGNVIGVNIARSGRTDSYAIPASHMQTLVTKLATPAVAQLSEQPERK